jgi:hypothetical protein
MSGEIGGLVRESGGGPPHSRTLRAFGERPVPAKRRGVRQSSDALRGRHPAITVRQNFNQRRMLP